MRLERKIDGGRQRAGVNSAGEEVVGAGECSSGRHRGDGSPPTQGRAGGSGRVVAGRGRGVCTPVGMQWVVFAGYQVAGAGPDAASGMQSQVRCPTGCQAVAARVRSAAFLGDGWWGEGLWSVVSKMYGRCVSVSVTSPSPCLRAQETNQQ